MKLVFSLASLLQVDSSVEILDSGATSWRNGPELPINLAYGVMVEDPLGKSF
jgi:hypothetical protein